MKFRRLISLKFLEIILITIIYIYFLFLNELNYYILLFILIFKGIPVRKQCIRALTHMNAYIIRLLGTNSCEMTYVTSCDFRG